VFTVERVTTFVYYCLNRHALTSLEPSGEEILKEQTIIVEQIDFLKGILPLNFPSKSSGDWTTNPGFLVQSPNPPLISPHPADISRRLCHNFRRPSGTIGAGR